MKNYTLAIGIKSLEEQLPLIQSALIVCGVPAENIQVKNLTVLVGIGGDTASPADILESICNHVDFSGLRWLNICEA